MTLRVMDLFSGIGGFSLGLKRAGGFRTVAYCEIDPYCQKVLTARMSDGSLDTAPICTDVTKLDGVPWRGRVDIICGGFPCQDLSQAGARAGITGPHSGLWAQFYRLICEIRPVFVLVENVPGLLIPIRERLRLTNPAGIGRVLGDLAEIGYDAEWESIPASTVGAPHDRDRVWIVAYPMPKRQRGESRQAEAQANVVGYPERRRLQGWFLECSGPQSILVAKGRRDRAGIEYGQTWESEPGVERVVDGVPDQVERINATGNAVVPQIPEWIGRRIMAIA